MQYYTQQIPLQKNIIYGPVNSRRLGRSLGINLLSTNYKVCSFDCLYCQYGFTKLKCNDLNRSKNFPSVSEVEEELEETLASINRSPDYITFSGNGEATLHPQFAQLVNLVIKIRDRIAPQTRTAILSNSTELTDPAIRAAIQKLDDKIMKLDCGSEEIFKRFNRPRCPITLSEIVNNLCELEDITIQALFAGGKHGNYFDPHVDQWIQMVDVIKPRTVQIYSLARGTAASSLLPVGRNELELIADKLNNNNILAKVY